MSDELGVSMLICLAFVVTVLLLIPSRVTVFWQAYLAPNLLLANDAFIFMLPVLIQSDRTGPARAIAMCLRYYRPGEWADVVKYLAYGYHFASFLHDKEGGIYGPPLGMSRCLQEWVQYEKQYHLLGYRPISAEIFFGWYRKGYADACDIGPHRLEPGEDPILEALRYVRDPQFGPWLGVR